jgi:hypothetical protein
MNQTQEQIEKLKSLRESLDWAIDLAENQLPELKSALQEIKDKVSNITIDLSPVAKEETAQDILSAVNGIATSMYKGVPVVSQTTDATIAPNVWNVWGEVASLTITKGTDIDGVVNNYMVRFTALEGAAITFDGFSLSWFGGEAPTWTAGNTYEISIVDNIALWAEIEPTA